MELWQSIPFACILLPLGSAAMTSVLKGRWARYWTFCVLTIVTGLSAAFVVLMNGYEGSYTYMMGHYPAPWGNEIRAGMLEALSPIPGQTITVTTGLAADLEDAVDKLELIGAEMINASHELEIRMDTKCIPVDLLDERPMKKVVKVYEGSEESPPEPQPSDQ